MPQFAYFGLIFKNSFSHWLKFIFVFLFSQTTLYICSYMHLLDLERKKKYFFIPLNIKTLNKVGVLRCPFLFLFCYFIGFTRLKFSQWQNDCGDLKTVNQKWHDAAYTSWNAERREWLWLLFTSKCTPECFIITVIYLKMRHHQPSHSTSLTGQWLKTVYHIKRKCKRGRFLWKRANLFEPTQQEHTTFCLVSGLVNISDLW